MNLFDESLHLFKELFTSSWFEYITPILFLTKRDLLVDMLLRAKADTSIVLPKYQGGRDYDAYMDWIKHSYYDVIDSKR